MTGYELSARWFAFCDENPEWVEPSVTALYFAIVQRSNELRWMRKFQLPALNTMQRIGIRSPKTYYPALDKLEKAGFIRLVERAKNQYTACIIELLMLESAEVKNTEAPTSAPAGAPTQAPTSTPIAEVKNASAPTSAQETYINSKTIQTEYIDRGALPEKKDEPDKVNIADLPTECQPVDTTVKKNKAGQMIKPTLEILTAFVTHQPGGTSAMAQTIFDFYTSKGWKIGKDPMVDWNAAARRWVNNNKASNSQTHSGKTLPTTTVPRPIPQTDIR